MCCSKRCVNFNNPFKREEFSLPKLEKRNFPRIYVGALLTHRYATTVGEQKPFSLEFEIISARPATLLSISISARTGMTIIAIRVRP